MRIAFLTVCGFLSACFVAVANGADFASEVRECVPAPGQWINNTSYNEPARALGPPSGGGTFTPANASVVSLGGFGGSIVIAFSETVVDDPDNYLGMDFIIFGNAYWASGDPQRKFAEPAIVEVMPDLDGDGVPGTTAGEQWYLIPGSLLADGSTFRSQTWGDVATADYPPANVGWFPLVGAYPYLPEGPCVIPIDGFDRYATSAFELPADIYADPSSQGGLVGVVPNPNNVDANPDNDHLEGIWGYAEVSPSLKLGDLNGDNIVDDAGMTPEDFYTTPDNPFRVGTTPGSCGGDAFDIAWAVDPNTWQPANLTGIRFVRISTGMDFVLGFLGESSAEIDAVADVRPVDCPGDVDRDADVDLVDLIQLRNLGGIEDPAQGFSIPGDLVNDGVHDVRDLVELRNTYLGTTCE